MNKTEKVVFIHSISFKIILLVIAITIFTLAGSVLGANNEVKSILEEYSRTGGADNLQYT